MNSAVASGRVRAGIMRRLSGPIRPARASALTPPPSASPHPLPPPCLAPIPAPPPAASPSVPVRSPPPGTPTPQRQRHHAIIVAHRRSPVRHLSRRPRRILIPLHLRGQHLPVAARQRPVPRFTIPLRAPAPLHTSQCPAPLPLRGIPPPAGTGSGPWRRKGRAHGWVAPGLTGHGGRFRLPHRPHRTTVQPPSGWCIFRWLLAVRIKASFMFLRVMLVDITQAIEGKRGPPAMLPKLAEGEC